MPWNLQADRPIYAQLVEQISHAIISGSFPPGSRMPSVRDLAEEAAVNPNTMQKALGELEHIGLVYTQRTAGRFVTEDTEKIAQTKRELAANQVRHFLTKMQDMGVSSAEVLEILESLSQEVKP